MRKPKTTKYHNHLTVRVERDTFDKITALAVKQNVTLSEYMRRVFRQVASLSTEGR